MGVGCQDVKTDSKTEKDQEIKFLHKATLDPLRVLLNHECITTA